MKFFKRRRVIHSCPSRCLRIRVGNEVLFNADIETIVLMLKFTGQLQPGGWAEVMRLDNPLLYGEHLIVELA